MTEIIDITASENPLPKQVQKTDFGFVLLGPWNMFTKRTASGTEVREFYPNSKEEINALKAEGWNAQGKAPFELGWQKKPYKFNDPTLLNHLKKGNNIGIIGGIGKLAIVDIDDPALANKLDSIFDTYSVKTGSGGRHFYFIIKDEEPSI